MTLTKLKLAAAAALALGVLSTGLFTHGPLTAQQPHGVQPGYGQFQVNPGPQEEQNRYYVRQRQSPPRDLDRRLADLEKRLEAALGEVRAIRQELQKSAAGETKVIKLARADARQVLQVLRAAFGGRDARFEADERTNSIIVSAGEPEAKDALKLLDLLDAPRK